MDFYLKIRDDKVIAEFSKIWQQLQNGDYYVHIEYVPEDKPETQFRRQFFAKLTELSQHTGHTKQELHEQFKHDCNIVSTKHFTKEEWCVTIEKLNWWAFENLEITI